MKSFKWMWIDNGPNEHFTTIKENAYSFLFNVMYPFNPGDINNDGNIDYLDLDNFVSMIIGINNDNMESF